MRYLILDFDSVRGRLDEPEQLGHEEKSQQLLDALFQHRFHGH